MCDPQYAVGKTTMAQCMQLVLLRLQDILLGKFITSGQKKHHL